MSKNKQIDETLLFDLIKWHVLSRDDNFEDVFKTPEMEQSIYARLKEKWEAWQKQIAFSQYKTGGSKEVREAARQEYLDLQGIHKNFRR